MKLAGDYVFEASVQDVWDALFDPAVLAAAMPGCEKLDLVDGELVGEMTIKVGPISGRFTGKVRLEDKVEPTSYRMIVDGRGAPGFVKATATIALAPEGARTRLTYDADAQIGGKIASVGERLVDASARAITKQSLDGLHENIKIRAAHHAAAAKTARPAAATTPAPPPAAATTPEQQAFEPTPAPAAPAASRAATASPAATASTASTSSTAPAAPTAVTESMTSTPPVASAASPTPAASTTPAASPTPAASVAATAASAAAPPGGPVYKKADAGAMASAVAKATITTMLPVIVAIAVGVAIVIWLIVR